ncbi:adenine nucleotide alpha hydrolases-like protein [Delitschia confertaspora ATCC 74209]|uniref:Adenine nucleotide alpha hydrolases-like protein n=1 Tax=Delitschia confertaspora ATCC 74209 TaxID=1513339 RepID=A0A9P4JJ60_9PLEO|nr:adenine nucleotide alpha hydrolases-like protein [Delitschia confertaspora ATCC 74209]
MLIVYYSVFQPRVSFDTFDKPADFIEENSFTLVAKHKDYAYTKRSRTFLCGCDDNEYSEYALQWLIDELVDDGDEIVCLRVVEDPSAEKARYRAEAESLMKQVQSKNHENKAINVILEFAVGKVNKVIDEMINLYEPAILVVGTRGRSLGGFQGLLPGSVSKYCLQHSPVPVIVVRPSYKRDKARHKRAQDPNRHGYKELLEKSGAQGGHILDLDHGTLISEGTTEPASNDEAAAVAAAIGYRQTLESSPLSQVETHKGHSADGESSSASGPISGQTGDEASAPHHLCSPGIVMKSPELLNLDSPEISDESSSDEESEERGEPRSSQSTENTDATLTAAEEPDRADAKSSKEDPESSPEEKKTPDV